MPPASSPAAILDNLPSYPSGLSRRLRVALVPVDITNIHGLTAEGMHEKLKSLGTRKGPLAEWMDAFLAPALARCDDEFGLGLHDPLAVAYALRFGVGAKSGEAKSIEYNPGDLVRRAVAVAQEALMKEVWKLDGGQDIRVETQGQWTRGACVADRRPGRVRKTRADANPDVELPGDRGGWCDEAKGNRVLNIRESPWSKSGDGVPDHGFGRAMLDAILGE